MKSGDNRPTALKALLRPFQMAMRSSESRGGANHRPHCCQPGFHPAARVGGNYFARPFQLDDENGLAARRILRVHGGLGRLERERIHDLHGAGQQTAGDDRRDGVAGLLQRAVTGQHGVKAFGARQELQSDFQAMPKRPSLPVKSPHQSGSHVFTARPPHSTTSPVAAHALDAENVIGSHPVLQAMRAAGIESHVAADRANRLAGGIGRVMQAVRARPLRDVEVDHARLDDRDALFRDRVAECGSADSAR